MYCHAIGHRKFLLLSITFYFYYLRLQSPLVYLKNSSDSYFYHCRPEFIRSCKNFHGKLNETFQETFLLSEAYATRSLRKINIQWHLRRDVSVELPER